MPTEDVEGDMTRKLYIELRKMDPFNYDKWAKEPEAYGLCRSCRSQKYC